MSFEPDDLIKDETVWYKVEVVSCAICPFGNEVTDLDNDYLGVDCTISNCKMRIQYDNWNIPNGCPLRNNSHCIRVSMREKNK